MGMMDRMFGKITGQQADKKSEVSGIRKKKDLGTQETVMSPGLEKQWGSKMAVQAQNVEDQQKMDDLRKEMADYQVKELLMQKYGGKKNYLKEAQESAKAWQQRIEAEKEIEKKNLAEQKAAQIRELEGRATRIGIDKTLELSEQRAAEEKARRERLDLE